MIRTPLLEPGAYFADERRRSLGRAIGVVIAYALVTVLVSSFVPAVESPGTGAVVAAIWSRLPFAVATTLLFWLGPAALLYGLATVAAGDGDPIDAVRVAAWGLGAGVVAWVVAFLVLLVTPVVADAPPYGPGVWFGTTVGLYVGALVWAGYIWTHGLVATFGLERRVAARSAALVGSLLFVVLIADLATVGRASGPGATPGSVDGSFSRLVSGVFRYPHTRANT